MAKAFRQNDLYAVELDENEWYGLTEDGRAELTHSYTERARTFKCALIAVFVIPDPVFPLYGHTKKHRVFEHKFPAAGKAYELEVMFTATIDSEVWDKLGEGDRRKLIREAWDALNSKSNGFAGRAQVVCNGKVLERGRV